MKPKRKTALKKKVTKIFYGNLPHPRAKTVGNRVYDQVNYPSLVKMGENSTITLPKNIFKTYWKQVSAKEKVDSGVPLKQEMERLFGKYNMQGANPLTTKSGQTKVRALKTHTSMSVGDIIQNGRKKRMVAPLGFRKVVLK